MQSIASLLIRGISQSFSGRTVLSDIELSLSGGERIGIVGPNGTGKSTLLRIAAGLLQPDEGSVSTTPAEMTVGYLPQEAERDSEESVLVYLSRRTGVTKAANALDVASEALAASLPNADDTYEIALQQFIALGVADFDGRVGRVVADLELPAHVLELPMTALSGGQAARVNLAALQLSQFDIFLLDEPTNDLDFDGLTRLEKFVTQTNAAMLIVSHDRRFLQRTINAAFELDEHSHTGRMFRGGWGSYIEERDVARRHAVEAFEVNQRERSGLRDRMQRQKQWTAAGVRRQKKSPVDNDKFIRNWGIESSENQAAKINASERALERLEVVEKPWEGWELNLVFKTGPRSGDVVARLDKAVVQLGDFKLGPMDEKVSWGERIAIVGPNGIGKSTFLNALLGRLSLTTGKQFIGSSVVVGEIDQAREMFLSASAFIDVFAMKAHVLVQEARSTLAKFGLTASHVDRPASSLSPGERTRASLALLMAHGTNCLVLDEPTNHLDITAIEQLEQALEAFEGTVLLVSHDREFLDKVDVSRTIDVAAFHADG